MDSTCWSRHGVTSGLQTHCIYESTSSHRTVSNFSRPACRLLCDTGKRRYRFGRFSAFQLVGVAVLGLGDARRCAPNVARITVAAVLYRSEPTLLCFPMQYHTRVVPERLPGAARAPGAEGGHPHFSAAAAPGQCGRNARTLRLGGVQRRAAASAQPRCASETHGTARAALLRVTTSAMAENSSVRVARRACTAVSATPPQLLATAGAVEASAYKTGCADAEGLITMAPDRSIWG